MDGVALAFQVLAHLEDGGVLHYCGDDFLAIREGFHRGEQRRAVGLGGAGGEDDLAVVGRTQQGGDLFAGPGQGLADRLTEGMDSYNFV